MQCGAVSSAYGESAVIQCRVWSSKQHGWHDREALTKLRGREGGAGSGKVKVKVNGWGHGGARVVLPYVGHQMLNFALI